MGESIPSSSSSLRFAASGGEMVHVVIKRQRNGVDSLKLIEKVPRATTFPAHARLLDMDDVRVRDIVTLAFERAAVELPIDAVVSGCAYDIGDETHKFAWICENAAGSVPAGVMRVIGCLRRSPAARRALFVAAWLLLAITLPSPFQSFWNDLIYPSKAEAIEHASPCQCGVENDHG
ncbi:hypothetical protein DC1_00027 [Burkholderia phage DC1]|uniref:Uncharacterized protein n=1 Tax=Burkholderia phage DC1 TaxID=2881398 RepID=I6NVM4_9CAUD|nr:hypothetical protein B862_gp56 [Burkholderia phage DC1]AEZ50845.1 hypothetical protein DC1_00027 [Burkholderia phage DC1]